MITTPFTQTDWLSTSNLFFILPLSYIFSSKKIFIVISVMRERVGSIPDTFNLYLASWWSICSCNLHLSLQLLISVFNCAEIFFHESGYFMAKVSIIQSNLDENNLLFLPLILKRFTLFFQVKTSNSAIHVYFNYSCGNMVNHSNLYIALSTSNYQTSYRYQSSQFCVDQPMHGGWRMRLLGIHFIRF